MNSQPNLQDAIASAEEAMQLLAVSRRRAEFDQSEAYRQAMDLLANACQEMDKLVKREVKNNDSV